MVSLASTSRARPAALLALVLALGACARGEPNLINIERGLSSPDEFAIVPGKPIEVPQDLSALPPPAPPGSGSRADATPEADAVAALGGNPARLARDGRAGDAALVREAGRYGVDGNVRADLAAEDSEFRRRNRGRVLERLVGGTRYFDVYAPQELNQARELDRFRRAGRQTPAAPPPPPAPE